MIHRDSQVKNYPILEDTELVRYAQNGDALAFEALYVKYSSRIFIYLTRMVGNEEIGMDLTQETFVKVWENLLRLREPSLFVSWLYRIAANIAYNHQRHAKHFLWFSWDSDENKESQEMSLQGPEKQVEETELLKQALAQVSPNYRSCLILYLIEGLSQKEIAEILGISANSVSAYVARGTSQLRKIYLRLINETADK